MSAEDHTSNNGGMASLGALSDTPLHAIATALIVN